MSKGNKTNEKAAVIMNKALTFLKHNIYYIIMGVCVLALATVITVAAVINSNKAKAQIPNDNEDILSPAPDNTDVDNQDQDTNLDSNEQKQVDNPTIDVEETFYIIAPLDSYVEGQGFSDTELVWNATQKHWATHEGMDFKAEDGSEVKCVFDGVVESVTTDSFNGTTVTISHIKGYQSVYKLLDGVSLKAGDKVQKGQVIGKISENALSEIADGPHLHFEILKDGKRVNPLDYLINGNK